MNLLLIKLFGKHIWVVFNEKSYCCQYLVSELTQF